MQNVEPPTPLSVLRKGYLAALLFALGFLVFFYSGWTLLRWIIVGILWTVAAVLAAESTSSNNAWERLSAVLVLFAIGLLVLAVVLLLLIRLSGCTFKTSVFL